MIFARESVMSGLIASKLRAGAYEVTNDLNGSTFFLHSRCHQYTAQSYHSWTIQQSGHRAPDGKTILVTIP